MDEPSTAAYTDKLLKLCDELKKRSVFLGSVKPLLDRVTYPLDDEFFQGIALLNTAMVAEILQRQLAENEPPGENVFLGVAKHLNKLARDGVPVSDPDHLDHRIYLPVKRLQGRVQALTDGVLALEWPDDSRPSIAMEHEDLCLEPWHVVDAWKGELQKKERELEEMQEKLEHLASLLTYLHDPESVTPEVETKAATEIDVIMEWARHCCQQREAIIRGELQEHIDKLEKAATAERKLTEGPINDARDQHEISNTDEGEFAWHRGATWRKRENKPSDPTYPENEKLRRARHDLGLGHISRFLEWLDDQKLHLCELEGQHWETINEQPGRLLRRYAEIDSKKLEAERKCMLRECWPKLST